MSKGRGHLTKRCGCGEDRWSRCGHSWRITASGGFDPETGKRLQHRRTVKGGRKDAERALTALLREVDTGKVADPERVKMAAYLGRWLEHQGTRVRPRTLERYRGLVAVHVTPRIGNLALGQVRPVHVQRVVDGVLADGRAPRTAVHVYRVLSAALRQAVRWQILAVNPAAAVSPPRPERPALHVPDPELVQNIIAASRGSLWLEGPVLIAATTGLRLGEVLGLRWADLDLEAGVARINASLHHQRGEPQWMAPKTGRGRRTVALPPLALSWLREHRKAQAARRLRLGEAWQGLDVVLDNGIGQPLRVDEVSRRFGAMVAREGWPRTRFHDLRHAYASALLRANVHPKVVSEALGHSTVAFTLDVYSHLMPGMGEQAATAIQEALGGDER